MFGKKHGEIHREIQRDTLGEITLADKKTKEGEGEAIVFLQKAGKEGEDFHQCFQKRKRRSKLVKGIISCLAILTCLSAMLWGILIIYDRVPGKLFFLKGKEKQVALGVPMTGTVEAVTSNQGVARTQVVNLAVDTSLQIEEEEDYCMDVRLFGVFPIKSVPIKFLEDQKVLPIGYPIGIYVDSQGVLVTQVGEFAGEDGEQYSPAKDILEKGDYIIKIDGENVTGKEKFTEQVEKSGGNELKLQIVRKQKVIEKKIRARKDECGKFKLGIWIKDNVQGVGTVTYMDEHGRYAALGHGINDGESGNLFSLKEGSIYQTEIINMSKSKPGLPGQMTGLITYNGERELGSLVMNGNQGIFGCCTKEGMEYLEENAYDDNWVSIALQQEVELGEAEILCTVKDRPESFRINITAIHPAGNMTYRDLEFEVTDERLLESTGGIVQGMSGSPILQNHKLIGAVTHVFVNKPTNGYGIFIEEMLEQTAAIS